MKMHFACKLFATLLLLVVRAMGQCNNSAGCFPAIGNIALYRNITTSSTCGENGITQFIPFGSDGSGGLMECLADNPSLAYPASNINDGRLDTSWQSDINMTNVTVQLDLEGPMLFESSIIVWSTPRPSAMIIERSSDYGLNWSPYRFFATDCSHFCMLYDDLSFCINDTANTTVITPDTILLSTDPVCTTMDSTVFPPMDSEITFNTSSHFYSNITDGEKLEYQTVTNLRLNLLGTHTDEAIETERYYGISEWFVYGTCSCNGHADQCVPLPGEVEAEGKVYAGCDCQHRTAGNNCEICQPLYNNVEYMQGTIDNASVCQLCQCFGHADECTYNSTIDGGVCICNNNTDGRRCDSCVAGFYRDAAMMFTDSCIDCGCFMPGVSNPMICDSSTGACFCKDNVDLDINSRCDTCLDAYWNISSPGGCQECSCSSLGSSSLTCDKMFGNCTCNENYLPPLCTDCMDGFFQLGSICETCDCNPVGAVNSSCTQTDGHCYCRENITNTRCNAPATGFYTRPLDFFVFEAEDAIYPNDTSKIFPTASNPTNFTGQGFLELTMTSTDVVFQFSVSVSYEYDLIIRYSTMTEGFALVGRVQSLTPMVNTNTSEISATLDVTVMPTHGATNVHTMTIEADAVYEARFTIFNFNFAISMRRLLLDSIVLMPRYVDGSDYLNSPDVLAVHSDTAEFCIPVVYGEVSPLCDPDLIFILSVEFFGQVYSCGCNPTGTEEATECSITDGTCRCKQGIGGTLCDRCIPSYFNFSVNGCTACNCYSPGVVDNTICDSVNGSCLCKANVDTEVNSICDTCLDGYWNISSENIDGCEACQCNPNGSNDLVCDKALGNCSCYTNYIGRTCSECADGYYMSNNQCIPCDCHPIGSNHTVCSKATGQCSCRPNIEGRRCNTTQAGFSFRTLDYIRFEAEDLSYSQEFIEVFPITTNPVYENTFTGRGYVAYPNVTAQLQFVLTVPQSSRYEMILRYRLSADTIILIDISSLTPTTNSSDCTVMNDIVGNGVMPAPLSSQQSFYNISFCWDEGTEYEVTVSRVVDDGPQDITFELDSIVLIPRFDSAIISSYYSSSTIQSCIPRAAGSVPPSNTLCVEVTFSLSVEFYGEVFECDCNATGTTTMLVESCEYNGGYCSCKDGVGGERCDRCLNGYYNFSIDGCTACACDPDNSISLLCQDDGQCSCTVGITGQQCDQCEDGRYNFTNNGCQPCRCEQLGSESNICNKLTGACNCIDGATGDLCNVCPEGSILTNTSYQRFCEQCRCHNRSNMCRADTGTHNLAAIISDFIEQCNDSFIIVSNGWTLEGNGTFTRCSTNGLGYNSSITDMDRLIAPTNFTGDLTVSYSLQLVVQLQLSQHASINVEMSTVEICGPGGIECLVGRFELDSSKLQSDRTILLSIPLRETYWWFDNNSAGQPTYLEFLYTLTDVTSLSFSASYAAMVETYYLQRISLQTLHSINTTLRSDVAIIEAMFPVEDCQQCSINYTGQFCENCAAGFYRLAGGLDCVACNCNNLSESYDPHTGACIGCRDYSTGSNCESCIMGFYGDPGRSISCQQCECGGLADPTCELDIDGNQTCTTCPMGLAGRSCELCADGYFRVAEGVCFTCQCYGNAMPPDGESICDMENGFCVNCSFNTTGQYCERCLPGYYGDPTGDTKCSECSCHVNGTRAGEQCNPANGTCLCKDGTTGQNCDSCEVGYWGLHLGGCRSCECCPHGSRNRSCNQTTGGCDCLQGMGSEDDDNKCCNCSPGYYNFQFGIGCQSNCSCSGAVISPQCYENGTCTCTEGAVGEKCDECGFEYSGEIPNCQRCSECFDSELETINELAINISSLVMRLDQLISVRAPLDNISDIISQLDYQLRQAEYVIEQMMINTSNVTLLEDKANQTKTSLNMLQENVTMTSDLLSTINSSVTDDLQIITMFDGTANGSTVTGTELRLENISTTVTTLNTTAHGQTLQQTLVEADDLQNDFDIARGNITESLIRINETTQMLRTVVDSLIYNITMQNITNKEGLSLLCAEIPMLQNDLQAQFSRVQRYEAQLNSTYLNAMTLHDSLLQSEQEILNSSIVINHTYNYSNVSLDLITNATMALQDLNDNVSSLVNRTQELLENITTQQDIVLNATELVCMANNTIWETLAIRTPKTELAQMLAREINRTFVPDEEVIRFATAVANSTIVAQQTLEVARNASDLVNQISAMVNDTLDKINASILLYDHVNETLWQLMQQQKDIENYASQVTGNLIYLNNSVETINNLITRIDVATATAYAIGIDNYNRSEVLRNNATELCTLARSLEQQSTELNTSLANISNEIDIADETATGQFADVQTLRSNATSLNATAHQIAVQQLQDLLDEYLADRERIRALTTTANSLIDELDQLTKDIEETSATLSDCIRTL